jgi:hypothetical protein
MQLSSSYNIEKRRRFMSTQKQRIDRRDDVNPDEGERKYGDVQFADPVNNKYPVDTPEHVRAAWSYINHKEPPNTTRTRCARSRSASSARPSSTESRSRRTEAKGREPRTELPIASGNSVLSSQPSVLVRVV